MTANKISKSKIQKITNINTLASYPSFLWQVSQKNIIQII